MFVLKKYFLYNKQMPNNAKKSVYKEKEFEIYLLWKSLPAHYRNMKKTELESSGFTDPLILKIIKIKNQTEFAKYFHIKDLGTLTDWNNKIKNENLSSNLLPNNFSEQKKEIEIKINEPHIKEIDKLKRRIREQEEIIKELVNVKKISYPKNLFYLVFGLLVSVSLLILVIVFR